MNDIAAKAKSAWQTLKNNWAIARNSKTWAAWKPVVVQTANVLLVVVVVLYFVALYCVSSLVNKRMNDN